MSTMSAGMMKVYMVCCKRRERCHQFAPQELYSSGYFHGVCYQALQLPAWSMVSFKLSLVTYLLLSQFNLGSSRGQTNVYVTKIRL